VVFPAAGGYRRAYPSEREKGADRSACNGDPVLPNHIQSKSGISASPLFDGNNLMLWKHELQPPQGLIPIRLLRTHRCGQPHVLLTIQLAILIGLGV
jgi:hypothetical protein